MAKKSSKAENLLIYSSSEIDSDMYYAVRFFAPDPFAYLRIKGKNYMWIRGLDEDRARNESSVDKVLSHFELVKRLEKKGLKTPSVADFIAEIAAMFKVKSFLAPETFPLGLADKLRVKGLNITVKENPFWEERVIKTPEEVKYIRAAEKTVLKATDEIVKLLSQCKIGSKNRLVYNGKTLTSEFVRDVVDTFLFKNGCMAERTIIAGGAQGSEPHNIGSGPLYAHKPIVCDIFPRSKITHYWGDFTRTFCVGKPSPMLVRMYDAVKKANEAAIKMVKPGVNARKIHETVAKMLEESGFKTENKNGRWVGFFHGTGHGLGLDIHEMPRVSIVDHKIRAGEVFTIEPGLYYPEEGGVRIEDVVVVTKTGCEVLSKYPKTLVIKPK